MINISLNGEQKVIATSTRLSDAMLAWGFSEKKCAVAINGEFVPRANYESMILNNKDEVDVVAPVGGG